MYALTANLCRWVGLKIEAEMYVLFYYIRTYAYCKLKTTSCKK
jgi:hypothetical protein